MLHRTGICSCSHYPWCYRRGLVTSGSGRRAPSLSRCPFEASYISTAGILHHTIAAAECLLCGSDLTQLYTSQDTAALWATKRLKVVVGAIFKTRGLCLNTHNFVTISHTNLIASRYIDLPFPCILVWLTN